MVLSRHTSYRAISKPVKNRKDLKVQSKYWWWKLLCSLQRTNSRKIMVIIIEIRNNHTIIIGYDCFAELMQHFLSRANMENFISLKDLYNICLFLFQTHVQLTPLSNLSNLIYVNASVGILRWKVKKQNYFRWLVWYSRNKFTRQFFVFCFF